MGVNDVNLWFWSSWHQVFLLVMFTNDLFYHHLCTQTCSFVCCSQTCVLCSIIFELIIPADKHMMFNVNSLKPQPLILLCVSPTVLRTSRNLFWGICYSSRRSSRGTHGAWSQFLSLSNSVGWFVKVKFQVSPVSKCLQFLKFGAC